MAGWLDDLADELGRALGREPRKRARRLRRCGHQLHFRHLLEVDEVRLVAGIFCQQYKLCPLCAVRRGAKLLRRYSEVFAELVGAGGIRGAMITWSVKNGENLVERFEHLMRAFGAMVERVKDARRGKHSGQTVALSSCLGGVSSVEIKRGSGSGLWHPHMHAGVLLPLGVDLEQLQRDLRFEWEQLTRDSYQVEVSQLHHEKFELEPTADNVAADLVEVFKYAVKLNELPFADAWHAFGETFGRQLVRPWGCLGRGRVKVPAGVLDGALEPEDGAFVDWFYQFQGGRYRLAHVQGGEERIGG